MRTEDLKGEVAGVGDRREGEEDKPGDGAGMTGAVGRGESASGRIGENRARLGFAMTNGGRGHSARRSYRSEGKRERVRQGLSTTLDSPWSASLCPGHLIRPQRGSFVFLVFQSRAAPYFPFVRAIYRAACPFFYFSRASSLLPFCLCSIVLNTMLIRLWMYLIYIRQNSHT